MDARRRALLASGLGLYLSDLKGQSGKVSSSKPLVLPRIGLGTWQTFDVGADAAARAELREVLKLLEGNVVDSSPMYGSAESVVGDLVAELGIRERVFIATKVWTRGRDDGVRQMETSFRRLRVQIMDLMQVHNLVDVAVHARTLQDMKAKGRVRNIGITHYTASAYSEVQRAMTIAPWDFLQINYSLAERSAEEKILPMAMERGLRVLVNRPFGEGSLFRKVRNKPLPDWAAGLGIASWAQYFLKWIVSHPAVTCAIPGTSNPKHMEDNLGAARGVLPDPSLRKKMTDYFDAL
ncbi:MAG TPA: aldo/keto reductase [Burkholderiales bacterium]|nr:aldo/keto reductase [Burkholderiales bacterium]